MHYRCVKTIHPFFRISLFANDLGGANIQRDNKIMSKLPSTTSNIKRGGYSSLERAACPDL